MREQPVLAVVVLMVVGGGDHVEAHPPQLVKHPRISTHVRAVRNGGREVLVVVEQVSEFVTATSAAR